MNNYQLSFLIISIIAIYLGLKWILESRGKLKIQEIKEKDKKLIFIIGIGVLLLGIIFFVFFLLLMFFM